MDLDELSQRLGPFCRAKYDDPDVVVSAVHHMPGHAGFSYGFTATSRGRTESWFLRLPPPNVQWRGTADVLRQVEVLKALDRTTVPHCSVKWSGGDGAELGWFGRPYFVVPKLEHGDVISLDRATWFTALPQDTRWSMARQAMRALSEVHRLDPRRDTPYLGDPIGFQEDVTRWDRFMEKVADPQALALVPAVRARLLATLPENAPMGVFHGDFQWSNLFFSFDGSLLAVIDWELTGVGATLNDVGWVATFNDPPAWRHERAINPLMPAAEELVDMYAEAWGRRPPDLNWYRALAAYKFAIITGFNLGLHRRGKRHDPMWEEAGKSQESLLDRAHELLG
jgi:aminoglycoside phosphotransferase (APT) family kinase protein